MSVNIYKIVEKGSGLYQVHYKAIERGVDSWRPVERGLAPVEFYTLEEAKRFIDNILERRRRGDADRSVVSELIYP